MATPIKRGRSYTYGVVQKDADIHDPKFRFKESSIPGDYLLDSGIETWEEFFLINPRNEKRTMTHTVYEIEIKDGRRTIKYVTEGMFAAPGVFRPKPLPQALGDSSEPMVLRESQPTPLSAYATNPISLPEVNEMVQSTVAAHVEFANEQIHLLRSIITDKDDFIRMLQEDERQKIDAATAMYTTRINSLEKQLQERTTEKAALATQNAQLQSQVDKLEWQAKEAKKIEERLQKDFEEATKVVNNSLADNNSNLGFLDKLLDRPIDEVVRGFALLKDLVMGTPSNSPAPSAPVYSQEQLQQLYEQAIRYGIVPGAGANGAPPPGTPHANAPHAGMPNIGAPVGGYSAGNVPVRPPAGHYGGTPGGNPGNPPMQPGAPFPLAPGTAIGGAPTTQQTPQATQPPYAQVQTV